MPLRNLYTDKDVEFYGSDYDYSYPGTARETLQNPIIPTPTEKPKTEGSVPAKTTPIGKPRDSIALPIPYEYETAKPMNPELARLAIQKRARAGSPFNSADLEKYGLNLGGESETGTYGQANRDIIASKGNAYESYMKQREMDTMYKDTHSQILSDYQDMMGRLRSRMGALQYEQGRGGAGYFSGQVWNAPKDPKAIQGEMDGINTLMGTLLQGQGQVLPGIVNNRATYALDQQKAKAGEITQLLNTIKATTGIQLDKATIEKMSQDMSHMKTQDRKTEAETNLIPGSPEEAKRIKAEDSAREERKTLMEHVFKHSDTNPAFKQIAMKWLMDHGLANPPAADTYQKLLAYYGPEREAEIKEEMKKKGYTEADLEGL